MDMTFLRRAERILADREMLRLDHRMLLAAVRAQQACGRPDAEPAPAAPGKDEPLVELLLAGPGWRRAIVRQGGCFSRAEAGRRVNGL